MNQSDNPRIFISYSHHGEGPKWKALLVRHLGVFDHHHLLDVWQDGKIRVGSDWNDDIMQAMSSSRLAVLLLTKESLESEYILNTEFPLLRERQKRDRLPVFPVVCEPCNWKSHDWLRATQVPNNSKPLSHLNEPEQDHVFRKLATDIAAELSRVTLAGLPKCDQPPQLDHIYLNKFPLTQGPGLREEKLIGREQELAFLDLAFAQPNTAIVTLIAWGGVGKSMLVQHWLHRLQVERWFGARHVYAWSFYSQGTKEDRQASEDTFLVHALEWFGVQCDPTLSPWDKGRLLADAVALVPTLLILDGIEPLQYPPGPLGGQLRAPGVQSLLKHLARKTASAEHRDLCLVTTREPLTDLASFQRWEDSPWRSVLRLDLGNLTDKAGAVLLHHAGANRSGAAKIKTDDNELLTASAEVNGHALTLNLLGRFLARAHSCDIRRRALVKFEEADRMEQGGTTFRMLSAFEKWFAKSGEFGARQLAILRMLGLFDRPADVGCISALRRLPVIVGLTDPLFIKRFDASTGQSTVQPLLNEDWNTATSFLVDFGLIALQTDADNKRLELNCHPLVREYFERQLHEKLAATWRNAHSRLYTYFSESAEYQPNSIGGMELLYQAIAHATKAGKAQEACEKVYRDRIHRDQLTFSMKQLGTYNSELAALFSFFERPWTDVLADISLKNQAWILHETAYCLRALGRLKDARTPMLAGLPIEESLGAWKDAAIRANNISEIELALGNIASAIRYAEKAVEFADRSGEGFQRKHRRARLADALHQCARRSEASNLFVEAEKIVLKDKSKPRFLAGLSGYQYCDLRLSEVERVAWRLMMGGTEQDAEERMASCVALQERVGKSLEWVQRERASPLSYALEYLSLGRINLYANLLSSPVPGTMIEDALRDFDLTINYLRVVNTLYLLPHGLVSRAWASVLKGDPDSARSDLDEAWDIAERGPMRLHTADIHLYRARLFFREKPYPWKSPQADITAARQLIERCGYWRRKEELEDAEKTVKGG